MKTETTDGATERRLLIAFICNSEFLQRVVPKWDKDGLFRSMWSNLIASWCVKYHKKHDTAPGRIIESLFEQWCKTANDADTKKLVERFLIGLSSEYKQSKTDSHTHLIDIAETHFNEVKAENLHLAIKTRLAKGQIQAVLEEVQQFRRVELSAPAAIDVLRDQAAQQSALSSKQKVLIRYPGPAGEFFGEELSEDSFVAFIAPIKSYKSQMLLDVAWRAMRQGNSVAYFQVGDLSTNQIMRRFHKRAAYRPLGKRVMRLPVGIIAPTDARDLPTIEYEDRVFEQAISWNLAKRAFEKHARQSQGNLWLFRHPILSVTIADIQSTLESWDRNGDRAGVVVIDYAENLAPINQKQNPLDQIAETWARMKQVAEMRRCLVITASQSNKEGFKAWVLTRSNFSGNKMKLAHVTAAIGINATDEERDSEIMRLNYLVRREERYSETQCLWCAMCLDIASPIVVSTMR